jgi:hypothetical protein
VTASAGTSEPQDGAVAASAALLVVLALAGCGDTVPLEKFEVNHAIVTFEVAETGRADFTVELTSLRGDCPVPKATTVTVDGLDLDQSNPGGAIPTLSGGDCATPQWIGSIDAPSPDLDVTMTDGETTIAFAAAGVVVARGFAVDGGVDTVRDGDSVPIAYTPADEALPAAPTAAFWSGSVRNDASVEDLGGGTYAVIVPALSGATEVRLDVYPPALEWDQPCDVAIACTVDATIPLLEQVMHVDQ